MGNALGNIIYDSAMQLIYPVSEADIAGVDYTLKHMFPITHKRIPVSDRRELARRRLCTRRDLSKFVDNEGAVSGVADLSPKTRAMLLRGKR